MAAIFYDQDADPSVVSSRRVAVIGYGSQGHAHALNLRESGVVVMVGLREGSRSREAAGEEGLAVADPAEAADWADTVMMLVPDQHAADLYRSRIADRMREGDALLFAHGFNIRFGEVTPAPDLDVLMVAPKGPGHLVRRTYTEEAGMTVNMATRPG